MTLSGVYAECCHTHQCVPATRWLGDCHLVIEWKQSSSRAGLALFCSGSLHWQRSDSFMAAAMFIRLLSPFLSAALCLHSTVTALPGLGARSGHVCWNLLELWSRSLLRFVSLCVGGKETLESCGHLKLWGEMWASRKSCSNTPSYI